MKTLFDNYFFKYKPNCFIDITFELEDSIKDISLNYAILKERIFKMVEKYPILKKSLDPGS